MKMGAAVLFIVIDRLDGDLYDPDSPLRACRQRRHFIFVSASLHLQHEIQKLCGKSPESRLRIRHIHPGRQPEHLPGNPVSHSGFPGDGNIVYLPAPKHQCVLIKIRPHEQPLHIRRLMLAVRIHDSDHIVLPQLLFDIPQSRFNRFSLSSVLPVT